MSHEHHPLPRWYWPMVVICLIALVLLVCFAPNPAGDAPHVHHEGCDHG